MATEISTGEMAAGASLFPNIVFSIITVTRNAAKYIAGCLKSVDAQTYPHVEHIVIDSASTDGTAAIVKRLGARVGHFVSEPDDGIYDAMNKGIALASGHYVLFLGADDRLADNDVLADAAEYLRGEGFPHLVYGDLEVREINGGQTIFTPPPVEEALDFLIYGCLPHQSTLARRELFESIGLFDTNYRVHGDYDWSLRVLTAPGVEVRYMKRLIGSFRSGGTSSQLQKSQEELYRIQNAFPVYQEPEWMMRRLLKFQQQTLTYRLQLDPILSISPLGLVRLLLKKAPRYVMARCRVIWPR